MSRFRLISLGGLALAGSMLLYSDKTAPPPVVESTDPLKGIRVTPARKKSVAPKAEATQQSRPMPARAGAPAGSGDDVMMRAIRDEMDRVKQLALADLDQPYHVEFSVDDSESFSTSATLGAVIGTNENRYRLPRVRVRVGDPKFDNTNYVFTDYFSGVRYDPDRLPLDDNYGALRRAFWLAMDRSYKTAVEAITRKRAALKNITQQEELADFWPVTPVRKVEPVARVPIDSERWTSRVRSLSSVFSNYPEVLSSMVSFDGVQTAHYFLNSEGTAVRLMDRLFFLQVRADGQAPDGMTVRDAVVIESLDQSKLPPEAELRKAVTEVADNVKALAAAPVGETYSGPVLIENAAAPQVIAELLGLNLALPRKPVGEPGRPVPFFASELEGRAGSRILPEFLDVIDDPSLKEWKGTPLVGTYEIDDEGVAAKPLTLVEKGRLKSYLLTRQPVRGLDGTNGRARLPGSYGARTATYSNLIVRSSESMKNVELKAKLLDLIKQRNKPYGLIVRKMDYPSSATAEELRRIATNAAQSGGGSRPVSLPLLVYRVTPDGKEELVRGLKFRGFSVRSLRDVMAVGDQPHLFHFMNSLAPFALMGAGGYVAPVSVIAPSMLFEDLELERPQEDLPNLPLVPPPALMSSR